MEFDQLMSLCLENTYQYGPVYHGGYWDGKSFIKTTGRGALGSGAYFTPNKELAATYAKESGGNNVIEAYLDVINPLILEQDRDNTRYGDPCVVALTRLGMDPTKAYNFVEKETEEKGYIGKQISSRAIKAGFDSLIWKLIDSSGNILREEIVIWDGSKVKVKTD